MDEQTKQQMTAHLEELRTLLESRSEGDPQLDLAVLEHIEELEALVQGEQPNTAGAQKAARGLEQRLLSWEAEHPQLVAVAARLARALESAGM